MYDEGDDEMKRTIQKAMWEAQNKKEGDKWINHWFDLLFQWLDVSVVFASKKFCFRLTGVRPCFQMTWWRTGCECRARVIGVVRIARREKHIEWCERTWMLYQNLVWFSAFRNIVEESSLKNGELLHLDSVSNGQR
jgi:hypothetical protein